MNQERFEALYAARWQEFDDWLKATTGRRKRQRNRQPEPPKSPFASAPPLLPLEEVPRRYRELCQHYALARDRRYTTPLIERLHALVLAGHQTLYGARRSRPGAVLHFLAAGLPRLVRTEWRLVLVASLLFYVPLVATIFAVLYWPDFAFVLVSPDQLEGLDEMYRPGPDRIGRSRGETDNVMMWCFYIANNVRIDFQCFAGGLLFGVGSAFLLLFNGLVIGTSAGYVTHLGYIENFWGFVAGHSAFELTGAVLSGAAGLRIGMALIAPGRHTRAAALKIAAKTAVQMLYGAATLTFLAAFIEGFWSPVRTIPVNVKYGFGIGLWILTFAYLLLAGRGGSDTGEPR